MFDVNLGVIPHPPLLPRGCRVRFRPVTSPDSHPHPSRRGALESQTSKHIRALLAVCKFTRAVCLSRLHAIPVPTPGHSRAVVRFSPEHHIVCVRRITVPHHDYPPGVDRDEEEEEEEPQHQPQPQPVAADHTANDEEEPWLQLAATYHIAIANPSPAHAVDEDDDYDEDDEDDDYDEDDDGEDDEDEDDEDEDDEDEDDEDDEEDPWTELGDFQIRRMAFMSDSLKQQCLLAAFGFIFYPWPRQVYAAALQQPRNDPSRPLDVHFMPFRKHGDVPALNPSFSSLARDMCSLAAWVITAGGDCCWNRLVDRLQVILHVDRLLLD